MRLQRRLTSRGQARRHEGDPLTKPSLRPDPTGGSAPLTSGPFNPDDRRGRYRIAVVTPDVLSARMAGPAIRAWHIASELALEHDVQLVTTSKLCEVAAPSFTARSATDEDLERLHAWADVLIVQGFVFEGRPFLASSKKVIVVDLYDPLHLEQLELFRGLPDVLRGDAVRRAVLELNLQLVRGDFFLCASVKQRDFWLGQMSALGRINPPNYDEDATLRSLIAEVPFGLPDHAPRHTKQVLRGVVPGIEEGDEVILWGGGIYNWFDPLTLLRSVDRLRRRRPRVRLFFLGLKHPHPEALEMSITAATRRLSQELGLTGTHVFFNEGWVPYEERQNYLLEADVGVSTHLDHLETAFAFRTRILDYIWAGLPIVATEGDSFAELIETSELGLIVRAGDVEALEEALFRILDDPGLAQTLRQNVQGMQSGFTWPLVLEPLVEFCGRPRRAPDHLDPEMAAVLRSQTRPANPVWRRLRRDLGLARHYAANGDFAQLADSARSRLRRALAGRR